MAPRYLFLEQIQGAFWTLWVQNGKSDGFTKMSIELRKSYIPSTFVNSILLGILFVFYFLLHYIGMVIFIFSCFGLGVILGMITCIKNLRSKSRLDGNENLAQSDLEIGKFRKIDRKWAKALGIDLKAKEKK